MCVNIRCVPVEIRSLSVVYHLCLVRAVIRSAALGAASALLWPQLSERERPENDAVSFLARPLCGDVAAGPGAQGLQLEACRN